MYAEIHAKADDGSDTKGRTTSVDHPRPDICIRYEKAKHLDASSWLLEIKAQSHVVRVANEDNFSAIYRDLVVRLTPAEVAKICNLAVAKGVLAVAFEPKQHKSV